MNTSSTLSPSLLLYTTTTPPPQFHFYPDNDDDFEEKGGYHRVGFFFLYAFIATQVILCLCKGVVSLLIKTRLSPSSSSSQSDNNVDEEQPRTSDAGAVAADRKDVIRRYLMSFPYTHQTIAPNNTPQEAPHDSSDVVLHPRNELSLTALATIATGGAVANTNLAPSAPVEFGTDDSFRMMGLSQNHGSELMLEEASCAICLSHFESGDFICVSNNEHCTHHFHTRFVVLEQVGSTFGGKRKENTASTQSPAAATPGSSRSLTERMGAIKQYLVSFRYKEESSPVTSTPTSTASDVERHPPQGLDSSSESEPQSKVVAKKVRLSSSIEFGTEDSLRSLGLLSENGSSTPTAKPSCAICLAHFQQGELVCVSNSKHCDHLFHQDCMEPWLLKHNECPLCRETFLEVETPDSSSTSSSAEEQE